jgi:hypothetical protein
MVKETDPDKLRQKRWHRMFYSAPLAAPPETVDGFIELLRRAANPGLSYEQRVRACREARTAATNFRRIKKKMAPGAAERKDLIQRYANADEKRNVLLNDFFALRAKVYKAPLAADTALEEFHRSRGGEALRFADTLEYVMNDPSRLGALNGRAMLGFKNAEWARSEELMRGYGRQTGEDLSKLEQLRVTEERMRLINTEDERLQVRYEIDYGRKDWFETYLDAVEVASNFSTKDTRAYEKELVAKGIEAWKDRRENDPVRAWAMAIQWAYTPDGTLMSKDWAAEAEEIAKFIVEPKNAKFAQQAATQGVFAEILANARPDLPTVRPASRGPGGMGSF